MPRRDEHAADQDFDFPALSPNGERPREAGPDPFDPEALRLSADLVEHLGVKQALLTVPVRRPAKEWFVRVHPDPAYRLETAMIELKEEGETYLVERSLWPELTGESTFSSRVLFTAISKQATVFLWPLRLPGPDGRLDSWSKSALLAAELAMTRWVRLQADRQLGGYRVLYADNLPDPTWPDLAFRELLRIAFTDQYIHSRDHLVLKQLRGEV